MRKLWQARSSGQSFLSEMRKQEESEKTSEKVGKCNGPTMAAMGPVPYGQRGEQVVLETSFQ